MHLVIQLSAERDLAEAHAYYAPYGKGDAFLAALDDTFIWIADRPLMFPLVYADVRRALVRWFPYAVFFLAEETRAVVLAIHHQRRDPASRPRR